MKTYYNNDYAASKHAFDTTRKAKAIAASLGDRPVPNLDLVDPSDWYNTTDAIIERILDPEYLTALKTGEPRDLAESQGFDWDRGIYPMARAHAAGLVAAVNDALVNNAPTGGSLSSGLHHARADWGAGFCTINGLAVAAHHARDLGARNILVLDFDAHGGGGTWSMTRDLGVAQIDVSVNPFDKWHPGDDQRSMMTTSDEFAYINDIKTAMRHASSSNGWDLAIYNAGMDPFNDGVGLADLMWREQLVAEWAANTGTPIVFALAGGYTWGGVSMEMLVDLHRLTLESFAGVDVSSV